MKKRIIDLTFTIYEGMQTFARSWHPRVEIRQLGHHEIEKRETRKLVIGTHSGTHVDAPRHFIKGGKTIENISLDKLVGPAVVADLSNASFFQEIDVPEIKKALRGAKSLERVIIRFDWDRYYGTDRYYTHHPFLSYKACNWLVRKGCRLVALDTPQPDNPKHGRGTPIDSPNHKLFLGNNVILVEYLTNIRSIKKRQVNIIVAPLKIKDGDGSPARVFAIEK